MEKMTTQGYIGGQITKPILVKAYFQVSVLIQMLPIDVNVNPNRRSAGAKLDVNDADLAKQIMFQTERKK